MNENIGRVFIYRKIDGVWWEYTLYKKLILVAKSAIFTDDFMSVIHFIL